MAGGFEPRTFTRNGLSFDLRHVPNRKSVALLADSDIPGYWETLGWLTDEDATVFAGILDRMLADPPATYGDGGYGDTP